MQRYISIRKVRFRTRHAVSWPIVSKTELLHHPELIENARQFSEQYLELPYTSSPFYGNAPLSYLVFLRMSQVFIWIRFYIEYTQIKDCLYFNNSKIISWLSNHYYRRLMANVNSYIPMNWVGTSVFFMSIYLVYK
jgi:hypothetical protein